LFDPEECLLDELPKLNVCFVIEHKDDILPDAIWDIVGVEEEFEEMFDAECFAVDECGVLVLCSEVPRDIRVIILLCEFLLFVILLATTSWF
jgi:hypothetical protein